MTEGRTVAVIKVSSPGELQDLDAKIKSKMILGENMTQDGKRTATVCQVCRKEGYITQIRDHIEANHVDGLVVSCNLCEKTIRYRNALRNHKYCHKYRYTRNYNSRVIQINGVCEISMTLHFILLIFLR